MGKEPPLKEEEREGAISCRGKKSLGHFQLPREERIKKLSVSCFMALYATKLTPFSVAAFLWIIRIKGGKREGGESCLVGHFSVTTILLL